MRTRRLGLTIAAGAATAAVLAATLLAAPAKTTVKVKGPSYSKVFTVVTCKSAGETDIALTGKARGLTLRVVGRNRTGTLAISGFADLRGRLTSVAVGDDGSLKVKGAFTAGGVRGPFTVTGSCA